MAPEIIGGEPIDLEDTVENIDDAEILQHLQSIDNCRLERKNNTNTNSLDCVEHAEEAGLFDVKMLDPRYTIVPSMFEHVKEVYDDSQELESIWKAEYDH